MTAVGVYSPCSHFFGVVNATVSPVFQTGVALGHCRSIYRANFTAVISFIPVITILETVMKS